jgi:hypothetical protein
MINPFSTYEHMTRPEDHEEVIFAIELDREIFGITKKYKLVTSFFIGRKMNINYKTTVTVFAILSVLIVTIISAYSAILTQVIQQTQAQMLNVTEQGAHITDVNVHFKTACVSIIVFTYCW